MNPLFFYFYQQVLRERFIANPYFFTNSKNAERHSLRYAVLQNYKIMSSEDYSSPRQTILPSFTINSSSKVMVGLYCTMSICTVERAGWP